MSESSPADLLHEAIRLLESVVSGASGQGSGSREWSGAELIEVTALGEQVGRLVDALRVEVAHEVDARTLKKAPSDPKDSLAHLYGFPSSHAFLQQLTLTSRATVAQRLRLGKACRTKISLVGEELPGRFPAVGDALFTGQMSLDTAEVITRMLGRLPAAVPYDHLELAEKNLVSHATGEALVPGVWEDVEGSGLGGAQGIPSSTTDIEQLAHGWVAALDQDGSLPKEEQLGRRYFRIGELHQGLVPVHGALLPEVAATLRRMFDAIMNPRAGGDVESDPDAARESRVKFVATQNDTDDSAEVKDSRTAAQKRHDAFASICNIAMKHNAMPSHNGEALTLTIQVTDTDLHTPDLHNPGGTAWVGDGQGGLTPLDTGAARHASCVGGALRVSQDGAGRITQLETMARIFNAHQRRAIMLRDGGCVIPGCHQSATWCEVHHVTGWAAGGKTHTDNGVLLCWYHHRHLETHGWNIRMVHGVPAVMAPAWLDPVQRWRQARSVHKPPRLSERPHRTERHTLKTHRGATRGIGNGVANASTNSITHRTTDAVTSSAAHAVANSVVEPTVDVCWVTPELVVYV